MQSRGPIWPRFASPLRVPLGETGFQSVRFALANAPVANLSEGALVQLVNTPLATAE